MQGQSQTSGGIANLFRMGPLRGRAAVQVAMIVVMLIGVVFVIISFASRSQAARSSFVQAHGVRREAVILNVDNIAHTSTNPNGSGHSTTYTAEVLVRLAVPVGGQAQTTVHVPNYEPGGPGDTLTVLVDPDNPGYAELPGSPSTPALLPTIFLAVGAFLAVVAITGSAFVARLWRRSIRRARGPSALPRMPHRLAGVPGPARCEVAPARAGTM
jgi:Kef-type K+ transport system membrane component KefB